MVLLWLEPSPQKVVGLNSFLSAWFFSRFFSRFSHRNIREVKCIEILN